MAVTENIPVAHERRGNDSAVQTHRTLSESALLTCFTVVTIPPTTDKVGVFGFKEEAEAERICRATDGFQLGGRKLKAVIPGVGPVSIESFPILLDDLR